MTHARNPIPFIREPGIVDPKREPDRHQHRPIIVSEQALQAVIDNFNSAIIPIRNELDTAIEPERGRAVVICQTET